MAVKIKTLTWEVIEVHEWNDIINIQFRSPEAPGKEMKWTVSVPEEDANLEKLVASVAPMAAAGLARQMEPHPGINDMLGKTGQLVLPEDD